MVLTSGNLVVPIVLWGNNAPDHHITSILIAESGCNVITGSQEGQLCVWALDDKSIIPKYLLFGHSSRISCLAVAGCGLESSRFVSSSENGELFLWDSADGRCLESSVSHYIHSSITAHVMENTELKLFCNGQYPEILVLDSRSLCVFCLLSSRVEPDWISCLCVFKPRADQDVVIGLSNSGMVKIWGIVGSALSGYDTIYEDESKQIKSLNAISINFCPQNQRTIIIVSTSYWQVYDASDFTLLCAGSTAADGDFWTGGCFIDIDKVVLFSACGAAYIYQLPTRTILALSTVTSETDPYVTCVLSEKLDGLKEAPFFCVHSSGIGNDSKSYILRGDSCGRIICSQILGCERSSGTSSVLFSPARIHSISHAWSSNLAPPGIMDHVVRVNKLDSGAGAHITATLYVPTQGRLIVGRSDGCILITCATEAIMKQMFGLPPKPPGWPFSRILVGHRGSVSCLRYPYQESQRYESNHLISGGADFSVCLWDLNTGMLLHRFAVQAGKIERLLIPPDNCNTRVLQCVCSVASDNSVALLGLKELKCVLLASRHLFPVRQIAWRPLDDFLIVQTEDGTLYVWQMETCNLDRVVNGLVAEDILLASQSQEDVEDNQDSRGFRSKLLDKKFGNLSSKANAAIGSDIGTVDGQWPLKIQGLKTSKIAPESHLLLFDVESLIALLKQDGQLSMPSATSESTEADPRKTAFSEILGRVKMEAESVGQKLQSTAEVVLGVTSSENRSETDGSSIDKLAFNTTEASLNMEIARILLSLLHSWGVDPQVDTVCTARMGLYCLTTPVSFGLISQEGYLSLLMPSALVLPLSSSTDMMTHFSKNFHWKISTSITTQHLLAITAVANTLKEIRNPFLLDSGTRRSYLGPQNVRNTEPNAVSQLETKNDQEQARNVWSLLATHHGTLLPELLDKQSYMPPRIELLARRWQERCPELREAAKMLLFGELNRMGPAGRRSIVEQWSRYLPPFLDASVSIFGGRLVCAQASLATPGSSEETAFREPTQDHGTSLWEPLMPASDRAESCSVSSSSSLQEIRRKQATAVVLLGVIGSKYSKELLQPQHIQGQTDPNIDYSLVRAVSESLLELLVHPYTALLPPLSPLRRAAVDLLGQGFAVWQPYLDISKVVLGLLEQTSIRDRQSGDYCFSSTGLPPSTSADAVLTARRALQLIAGARPPALITALSKEIARYNQTLQHQATQYSSSSPLVKSKAELLYIIEFLVNHHYNEVADLILPVGEITVFCLDVSLLKHKSLLEVYPPITKFNMVAYCPSSRRIAFGGKTGLCLIHDLRSSKSQTLQAHSKSITAVSFSDDGKMLTTYCAEEGKLNLWQVAQSFLGMGQTQIKLLKQVTAPSVFPIMSPSGSPLPFKAKVIWTSPKTVSILLPNGNEHRITVM